jgi:hydroxylaminobenzene mutase
MTGTLDRVRDLLVGSGLVQLTFGVWLGWAVLGFAGGRASVGPFRARGATLQCHLDNLMMGGLQLAVAGALTDHPEVPTLLIVFGSWVNPQLFLAMAIGVSAYGPVAARPTAADATRRADVSYELARVVGHHAGPRGGLTTQIRSSGQSMGSSSEAAPVVAARSTDRGLCRRVTRTVRFASFGSLTVGYPWLAVTSFG